MAEFEFDNLEAPQLEPYRNIRGRNWTEHSGIFVVEGPLLVERLLSSDYGVKSVLVDRKYYHRYAGMVPAETDVLVIEHELVEQLAGFNFHRGVLGCGIRKPEQTIKADFVPCANPQETLVAVVGVEDPANLGGILRSCAALGVARVVMGPGTADPLSRRALRVSTGNTLRLQIFRSRNMLADLQLLKQQSSVESIATSLLDGSQALEDAQRSGPVIILLGNEMHGLPAPVLAAADRRVRIDMQLGADSLNVSVAAGIIMHHFCRLARSGRRPAKVD